MKKIKKFMRKYKKPQYLQTYKRLKIFLSCAQINFGMIIVWVVFKFFINKNNPTEFGIKIEIVSGTNTLILTCVTVCLFILFLLKKKEEDEIVSFNLKK